MRTVLSLIVILAVGWYIAYMVLFQKYRMPLILAFAISYGFGMGAITLTMLLLHFCNIKFTGAMILTPWIIFGMASAVIFFRRRSDISTLKTPPLTVNKRLSRLASFLILGLAFEIFYVFFLAFIKPMESYDAVAMYAFKAKIFYLAQGIPSDFFHTLGLRLAHPDYPLSIPLGETFVYLFLGNVNDQLVKIIFPLYYSAVLVMLYFAIRRFGSASYALLFSFILATIPQFSAYAANGYLDVPLAYYCFASIIFLFFWFEDTSKTRFLICSAIMVSLAGWTKNEGLVYGIINAAVLIVFLFDHRTTHTPVKAVSSILIYVAIVAAISAPWLWVKVTGHLKNSDIDLSYAHPAILVRQYHKIIPILYEFQKQCLGPKKWNILWIVALFLCITRPRKIFSEAMKYQSFYLILVICSYLFFYFVSHIEINYFLSRTWSRFPLHFLPSVVYWMACIAKKDIDL